jgi:hypothetical protein
MTSKFRDTINREMGGIQLSDDIKMNVLDSKYIQRKKRFNFKPLVVAMTAICTASILTIGVGAVAFGGVSEFINGVNIMFEPINETCTSNGIKLTVLSAGIDSIENKTMSAYVTLEDITEQNRITQDSSFMCWVKSTSEDTDSNNAHIDSTLVSFDEDTHIATYKVVATMNWWNTFSNKNTILSDKVSNGITVEHTTVEGIDLYALAKDNLDADYTYYDTNYKDKPYSMYNFGMYGCYKSSNTPNVKYKSIVDNIEPIQINDDIQLLAIGFVDGHLHVKLKYTNYYETAYHPENLDISQYFSVETFALVDTNGNDILNTNDVYSSMSTRCNDTHTQVIEVCFNNVNDISKLEGLRLSYGVNTTTMIDGSWAITFKMDDTITE